MAWCEKEITPMCAAFVLALDMTPTYSIMAWLKTLCRLTSESRCLCVALVVILRLLPVRWPLTVLVFAFVHDVVVGFDRQFSPSVH
jgi:hypothetical protein